MAVSVPPPVHEAPSDPASTIVERDRLSAQLRSGRHRSPAVLAQQIRELERATRKLRGGTDEPDAQRRMSTLVAINAAIGRLQALEGTAAVIEAAPAELCRSCGFSRAMISRVRGSRWVPEVLHVTETAPVIEDFMSYVGRSEIPLEHMLLETDLVRRRVPALVRDARNDPRTFKEIVDVSQSTSYAASPIMPTRRVIGFFHVDRPEGPPLDETDRDNLWAFAEHFGLLFERVILIERLERQRAQIHSTLMEAAAVVNDLCSGELELTRTEHPVEVRAAHGRSGGRPSALASLLSAREREVLELVASGATNTAVAEQLVISQGTVKSHVKRILRKLHVANRAEAVARYLQLLRLEGDEDSA
ncbi:MAG: response regulator containing a CheY-like receiver domain and an DNA-binding domain [Solirubrobacterales bacterium]|nr:response regulator containing a CheY-like receiver domain and an DNA-binding domain [Solirubrobacterales bacterium]